MYPLFSYLISIAPAGLLAVGILTPLPRPHIGLRVAVYILFFIFARDAMGPHGFWQLAPGTLRLTAPDEILLALASICVALTLTVLYLEAPACGRLQWWRGRQVPQALVWGAGGAVLIGAVAHLLKVVCQLQPVTGFNPKFDGAILIFALAGNLFEELLFRGILQSRLAVSFTPLKAITLSAFAFSFCHIWLALINSGAGVSVFIFTALEGWVAGFVYWRSGLLAATLAHGLAIYGLAVGIY